MQGASDDPPTHQKYKRLSDVFASRRIAPKDLLLSADRLVSELRSRPPRFWLIGLIVLIIVGVVCGLIISQLVPASNPWQPWSDTSLGFTVLYPTDWQVLVDHQSSMVHFSDSTHTDNVAIARINGAASDVAQFLQEQASHMGLSNVTASSSRTFADTSWQQVEGKWLHEGVSDRVTMLATVHGNHLYVLTQQAPQSTYNDEETIIFAPMRAGLRFF